jgi:transketolase
MGMADIAEVLWNDFLRHNPTNPLWPNRDRFVLSNGHGSMLLYSLLHLSGYDLPMAEIKRFRQLHSKTPGHPEYGHTPGIETTTGPLGQGLTNAVGMAIAEKALAGQFNKPNHEIIDHRTYVFVGDGCLMEGISHEACSLAGTLGLGNLIVIYDDNGISIDGEVVGWFTDDTPQRFSAYGWHVIPKVDGHDDADVKQAIEQARAETTRPSLICCQTVIGWGSPNKQGKEECHGAALGQDEVALVRETIDWPYDPFFIPDEIYNGWNACARGKEAESHWNAKFAAYKEAYPELAREFERRMARELPQDWEQKSQEFIQSLTEKAASVATRKASQMALNGYGPLLPELIGGSADLAGSNLTIWSGSKPISKENGAGNYIYFGVREFGMSAILNGLALYGGFIPYGATFLVFSEYARNALRMAALMKIRSLFVYTHDSIGLGEDGPTHQAVEQIATLRMIPNMSVWRPGDEVESAVAWKLAIERQGGPSCLIFSRQSVPHQDRTPEQLENISRGGYILKDSDGSPEGIIIATGSELGLAVAACEQLSQQGKKIRVVSMPCTDVFDAQDEAYKESVLPTGVTARVAVEAGVSDYWIKYVGLRGKVVGIDRFGESAPAGDAMKYFGFTADNVAKIMQAAMV